MNRLQNNQTQTAGQICSGGDSVVGNEHSCALLDNSQIKCWGDNYAGQLGVHVAGQQGDSLPIVPLGNDAFNRPFSARKVSAGGRHTCAILRDHGIKCWGDNDYGELGQGDTTSRGGTLLSMGSNLNEVNLPLGDRIRQIETAGLSTCVLVDNDLEGKGIIRCWGDNTAGKLGLGDNHNRGDSANNMGDHLQAVDLGTNAQGKRLQALRFSMASGSCCALLDNDLIKCWGNNHDGQLGLGDTNNRGDEPNEMGNNLPFVNLGKGRKVRQIVSGDAHSCAVLDNAKVKCWGGGAAGALGLGDTTNRGDGPSEMGDDLPYVNLGTGIRVRQLSSGGLSHTCALFDNGQIKCWGSNFLDLLGLIDHNDRGDNPREMGDSLPFVNLGLDRSVRQISGGALHNCALLDNGQIKCWGVMSWIHLIAWPDWNINRPVGYPREIDGSMPGIDLGVLSLPPT